MDISHLASFRKPGRYIGREWNVCDKSVSEHTVKVCYCFPDFYELGMSTLSGRIIYGYFNQFPEFYCDRAFLPAEDYQAHLSSSRTLLSGVQSGIPLRDFDLVGFTMNYELNYVNFLKMLSLAGIPVRAEERDGPVIGIGGCANPLPLSRFIDFYFHGELEASPPEFLELLRKKRTLSRKEFLIALADIPGMYVPSISGQKKLERMPVRSLNDSFYPQEWLVPYVGIVHDRAYVEVSRGCPRQCAFCQARAMYYPYRERSPQKVIDTVRALYRKTGYEDISLLGLSVSDYSGIVPVLKEIISYLGKYGVKISLPSLRATDLAGDLSSLISQIKKSGLTIAIETVSPRLRELIRKPIDHQQLLSALEIACGAGYRRFKFYFMIGLPGETQEDLDAMIGFIRQVNDFLKRRVSAIQLNLNISHFIPKPLSALEYETMTPLAELQSRTVYLYQQLKYLKNVSISIASGTDSLVEAVLSRGDERIGDVLEYLLRSGQAFGQDQADFKLWEEAFRACGFSYEPYIYEKKSACPWEMFSGKGCQQRDSG